jgi:catechol-2,3-dioxygenase
MISAVSKVVVAVDDQKRAKQFWTTRIGFDPHRDESYGQERWIAVGHAPGRWDR